MARIASVFVVQVLPWCLPTASGGRHLSTQTLVIVIVIVILILIVTGYIVI